MCLVTDEAYAGPRSGLFFKVLRRFGGLRSPYRGEPYPERGPLFRLPPRPRQPVLHGGMYHVFVNGKDALAMAVNLTVEFEVHLVRASAADFVAGGSWEAVVGQVTAGFLCLDVVGPFTGND